MLDGDPAWPDLGEQWRLAEQLRADRHGRQPAVPDGLPQGRADARREQFGLSSIRALITAGSPLPAEGYR